MDKEKVIEKVQKLLALTESSNPHEAALAAERAGDILAKYDLSMMEVLADQKEEGGIIKNTLMESFEVGNYKWETILMASIAPVFDCSCIRIPASLRTNTEFDAFQMFGTKYDLEMLTYFFRFLRMRIHTDTRAKFKTKKERASYASSFIGAVKERLDAMYSKKQEAVAKVDNSEIKDMVIYKKDLADQALKNEHKRITTTKISRKLDRNAYQSGTEAGNKVPLSTPIEGGKGGEANQIN